MRWTQIARRQHGVVGRSQLRAAGLTDHQIDRLLRNGLLETTMHRGVYAVAGAPRSPEHMAWLAVIGSNAVFSFLSAGPWWDVPVEPDGRIHITRFDRQRLVLPKAIRVHRTLLLPSAVTERYGLRITTRSETLLDCLGWVPIGQARTLLDRAYQQKWLTPDAIQQRLDEQSGRWGNRQLSRLLRESDPKAESEAERRGQRLLRKAGVTGWEPNLPTVLFGESFRIDIAFPKLKIAIEIDGWAFHRSKARKARDERKANALARAGWTMLKFGWEDVQGDGRYFLTTVAQLLAARPAM